MALLVGGCSREPVAPRAVSDGKEPVIAYASLIAGQAPDTIHVMKPDGSEDRLLALIEEDARSATFSPDGRTIAFIAGFPSQLFVMDVDGANVRQLTKASTNVIDMAFSPDSKRIAYTDRDHKDQDPQKTNALYVIDAAGGEPKRLVERFTAVGGPRPAFTPDGGAIVFGKADDPTVEFDGEYGTYSVNLDTRETTQLPIPSGDNPSRLQFSPNGSKMTYVLSDDASNPALYVADANFSNARKLVDLTSSSWAEPSFSPDGRLIAYTDTSNTLGSGDAIFVINVDGSDRRQLTNPEGDVVDTAPSWGYVPREN